jgi:carboxylate-amine ligase
VDEGEPLADHPHRLLEENFWRAIRFGLAGDLLDLARTAELRARPARAAIEELIDWVLPVAREVGVADLLEVPAANPAERQLAAFEDGASLEQIYRDEVARTHDVGAVPVAGATDD